ERGILDHSPCESVKAPSAETSRDRVLSDGELVAVWNAAASDGFPFGSLVQLLILTGQRLREVAAMSWSEVDFDKRVWTLPRERTKGDRAHEVPLSEAAIRVFETIPRAGKLVFSTNGKTPICGFSRFKERVDAKLGAMPPWTLHDLRR